MKRIYFLVLFAFFSVWAMAQEGGTTNIDVNLKSDTDAGGFPWLWVVGGLVFLILLVALLNSGKGGTDRVIEKKTIVRD